jgi:hypothetical protein
VKQSTTDAGSRALPPRIPAPIEIGAGIGDYAVEWLRTLPRLTVSEADDGRLKILHERFVDDLRVTVRRLVLPSTERCEHSAAIALNVLEHIEEDVAAVRSAARLLRPGGAVVLVVPAFPSAMSRFDRAVGHFRRYTADSLSTVLVSAGLAIEELHYLNPIGLINWYLVCPLLGTFPRNGNPPTRIRPADRASSQMAGAPMAPAIRPIRLRRRPPPQPITAPQTTATPQHPCSRQPRPSCGYWRHAWPRRFSGRAHYQLRNVTSRLRGKAQWASSGGSWPTPDPDPQTWKACRRPMRAVVLSSRRRQLPGATRALPGQTTRPDTRANRRHRAASTIRVTLSNNQAQQERAPTRRYVCCP